MVYDAPISVVDTIVFTEPECIDDLYAYDAALEPLQVCSPGNETLIVAALPLTSFATKLPAADVTLDITLDPDLVCSKTPPPIGCQFTPNSSLPCAF